MTSIIVNDITNFCFRILQKPYTEASVRHPDDKVTVLESSPPPKATDL